MTERESNRSLPGVSFISVIVSLASYVVLVLSKYISIDIRNLSFLVILFVLAAAILYFRRNSLNEVLSRIKVGLFSSWYTVYVFIFAPVAIILYLLIFYIYLSNTSLTVVTILFTVAFLLLMLLIIHSHKEQFYLSLDRIHTNPEVVLIDFTSWVILVISAFLFVISLPVISSNLNLSPQYNIVKGFYYIPLSASTISNVSVKGNCWIEYGGGSSKNILYSKHYSRTNESYAKISLLYIPYEVCSVYITTLNDTNTVEYWVYGKPPDTSALLGAFILLGVLIAILDNFSQNVVKKKQIQPHPKQNQ